MPGSFAVLPVDVSGDGFSFSDLLDSSKTVEQGDGNSVFTKKRKPKRKKKKILSVPVIVESSSSTSDIMGRSIVENALECSEIKVDESDNSSLLSPSYFGELRQRNVKGDGECYEVAETGVGTRASSCDHVSSLSNQGSMDWEKVIAAYPDILKEENSFKRFPLSYFMAEINDGSSFRSTMSVGIERKRQRVYNTMFHVPLRCERLIDVGFFVCLDTFLSLLTIMPARILIFLWRIVKTRQFQMPNDRELSDFGCFIVLVFGVIALQSTDISLIYHIIRGQGTVKLYVVYNVLEIFDNLLQSFGEDVLQVLFNSIEGVAGCSSGNLIFDATRYILDQIIAIIVFTLHSFILLAAAITLSTCVIAHNNALLALLISNNFAEIKSNVFKRVSKDNIHSLVCHDIVERFHIAAFVLFIFTQNILESEGSWFGGFISNVMLVYMCEVLIDIIKHSFLAKFNEIKPVTYSEFLEDLCKQILNIQPEDGRKNLTFIPLAPACVNRNRTKSLTGSCYVPLHHQAQLNLSNV
ncbi:POLLEN DEFECTIVE IN GUIDANCE-like protein isoform X2 [Wolffia australiana]